MTPNPPNPNTPLVTVSGEFIQKVVPDQLSFSFQINTTGKDLVQAQAKNSQLINEVLAYLKKEGVPERNIQTSYINIGVNYLDGNQRLPEYTAFQSVTVKLQDIEKFGKINNGLLERGVTGINGPELGYSKADELKEEVRIKALLEAQKKAKALAQALGQDIGPAFSIVDVRSQDHYQPMYRMAAMDAESSGGFSAGEISISHSVVASFMLR